jgi:hypothetical protein
MWRADQLLVLCLPDLYSTILKPEIRRLGIYSALSFHVKGSIFPNNFIRTSRAQIQDTTIMTELAVVNLFL